MSKILLNLDVVRRIESANYCFFKTGILHPDRVLPVHDMVYIVQGEWEICEDGKAYLLKPGDVILLFSGRHHYGKSRCADNTRTLFVHFYPEDGDTFSTTAPHDEKKMEAAGLSTFVSCGKDFRISHLFEEVVHSFWSSLGSNKLLARIKLAELLANLSGLHENQNIAYADSVDYVINKIERDPYKLHNINELAETIRVSRRTLTKCFKAKTGLSVKQFQLNLKLQMAASLLENSPFVSVKEVAEQFGFYDEFHFSRLFRRKIGKSPSEYRTHNHLKSRENNDKHRL
jgi:AraC-like DNA-binding protein